MELWVRSQNKLCLKKVNELFITGGEDYYYIEDQDTGTLGNYVSEERALEVLNEIQNLLQTFNPENMAKMIVYEMPEE